MALLKRPINFSLQTHCVQSCHTARPYFSGTKHCYSPLASCSCLTSTFSCHNSDFSLGFSLNYTLISEFQSAWEFHTHDFLWTRLSKGLTFTMNRHTTKQNKTEHHTGLKPSYVFLVWGCFARRRIGCITSYRRTEHLTAHSSDLSLSRG